MNGLELARLFYEQMGVPMLQSLFAGYQDQIAVGLAGEGSECFGFDDEQSRDHDWGPAFCLWLSDETADAIGAQLQAAYDALDPTPLGFGRRNTTPEGAGRVGVMRTSAFYRSFTGLSRAPQTLQEWRRIPEAFLATATNGVVFYDPLGHFSGIRSALLGFYPEDIRIKKIAARAAVMAQAGQYNYSRCVKRGELVAASMALNEFTRAACSMIHLLNKSYTPYYKWMHRSLRRLPRMRPCYGLLAGLYSQEGACSSGQTQQIIEAVCAHVTEELLLQGLTDAPHTFLLDHGPALLSRIEDETLRQAHIMTD